MSDPHSAQERAKAAGERAAEQLAQARAQDDRVERVSWVSRNFLRDNHFRELVERALALGGRST